MQKVEFMSELVTIRLSRSMKEALEREAKEENVTMSDIVRTAVKFYFEAKESKQPLLSSKVEKLLYDSTGFFGFSLDKFVRLAKERGIVGDEWTDENLRMVLEDIKDEIGDSDSWWFGAYDKEEIIEAFTQLGVDRDRVSKMLDEILEKPKGVSKPSKEELLEKLEKLEKEIEKLKKSLESKE